MEGEISCKIIEAGTVGKERIGFDSSRVESIPLERSPRSARSVIIDRIPRWAVDEIIVYSGCTLSNSVLIRVTTVAA